MTASRFGFTFNTLSHKTDQQVLTMLTFNKVDITNRTEDIDLNNYVQNGEWDLVKTSVVRNVVYYPCW